MPRLLGRGVVLRSVRAADLPRLQELANDRSVARFTRLPHPYTVAEARAFLARVRRETRRREGVYFVVTDRATGEVAGTVALMHLEHHVREAELGYWIGKPYRGRGFATEAARLVTAFGLRDLGLVRVYAKVKPANRASRRVLARAGLRYEGLLRQAERNGDRWHDVQLHAKVRRPRTSGAGRAGSHGPA